jgi:hypothetical protein
MGVRAGRTGVDGTIGIRISSFALRANVDNVSEGLPANERGPLANHPVGIELRVRRCTVGQDEHQGEGTKEGEDKFP